MELRGYLHDIKDVKVLILYVMAQMEEPVSAQTIYELCYQDDSLSYFTVQEAIPQMIVSGHLEEPETGMFVITEKGREAQPLTEETIAFTVRERASIAVKRRSKKLQREKFLRTDIQKTEKGELFVHMAIDDPNGNLMELSVQAPTLPHARKLEASFLRNADVVYQSLMIALLEEEEV
jgi:hypothetical protein